MKNLLAATAFAAVLTVGTMQTASAAILPFDAVLSGANEFPANGSPGTGFAVVNLDTIALTLRVQVTFSGLTSGNTASHIHCCLPSPLATGVNVGVATITPTFTGFPGGVTSGSYDHTFDLTAAGTYNPNFITAQGSLAAAENALIMGIENEETYLNIHTTNFPGGEIRGILVPAPEPVTWTLFGAGLAGVFVMRRRKAKA